MQALERSAHELFAGAHERGLELSLLGGMGIRILLGERLLPAFERPIQDLDFITTRASARGVEQLLADAGWAPDVEFNALNGLRRMLFERGDRQIDVFVDAFEMCHRLPLAEQIDGAGPLPAADLLLTKLQIVELNAKDRGDCYALLAGLPVDADGIDGDRIAALCARDWGLQHTVERNLSHLAQQLPALALPPAAEEQVATNQRRLDALLTAAPKSRAWRLRARIGERKRWYEDVEEVRR